MPLRLFIVVAAFLAAFALHPLFPRPQEPSGSGTGPHPPLGRDYALWRYRYRSAQEMLHSVHAVVVATVASVATGRAAHTPGGGPPLLFEEVTFRLEETLRLDPSVSGDLQDGFVTVERLRSSQGSPDAPLPFTADGGAFRTGVRYLLFLRKQTALPFRFIQVNDEGRYEIVSGGNLESTSRGPVAGEFEPSR